MDSTRTGRPAQAEAALKARIKRLQKQVDEAVKRLVNDDNRLHTGQTPVTLARKALIVRKPPKGRYTLAASLVHALQHADSVMLSKLATSTRAEQAALIGPATVKLANSTKDVRLSPSEVNPDWLSRDMKMPQREKAHAALLDSWKEIAKIRGRGKDRLNTPAKFLDFIIAQRQSARSSARSTDTTSLAPTSARRPEDEIWFTDKQTVWFRLNGQATSSTVSWQKRPSSSQFRMPGAAKTTLSTFGKSRGYSLEELIRISDDAQAALDAATAREREADAAQAAMEDSDLFETDSVPSVKEATYAA